MSGGVARHDGFALLLVLWTMVLLSLIGTRIATTGRVEAQLAANIRDAAVTEAAADGAVQDAAFRLLAAPPQRWPAGGIERSLVLPGVAAELLAALARAAGADTQSAASIAAAIVEWRFPGGAEEAAMRQRGAWIRGRGALTPTPPGVRRSGRSSGVPGPACG